MNVQKDYIERSSFVAICLAIEFLAIWLVALQYPDIVGSLEGRRVRDITLAHASTNGSERFEVARKPALEAIEQHSHVADPMPQKGRAGQAPASKYLITSSALSTPVPSHRNDRQRSRQRLRRYGASGYMKDRRCQLTRNLEHVWDHQQQALRRRKGRRQRSSLKRAMHRLDLRSDE